MEQYPYTLYKRTTTGGGRDEGGNPLQGVPSFENLGRCRDEARRGEAVNTVGGDVQAYTSFVFTPRGLPRLQPGTYIEVREADGTVRLAGDVKRYRQGHLHCRLWV